MGDSQFIWGSYCEIFNEISCELGLNQTFHLDIQQTHPLCVSQPYCSLHLHLHVSENPYTSGNIISKESAPGIIIASGEDISWNAHCFAHSFCCLPLTVSLSALSQTFFCLQQCLSELTFTKWNWSLLHICSMLL